MRVVWSPAALGDIDRIYDYILGFNPRAAAELALRLLDVGKSLQHFPERGRPIGGGRREHPVIWPYVIRYRVKDDTVQILRIRHGKQRPLP